MSDKKYNISLVSFTEVKNKITVPKFQRGLKWNESKKEAFMNSIKNGFPFGTILLQKGKDDKFRLLDGLQRYSTLLEYQANKNKLLKREEVDRIITNNKIYKENSNDCIKKIKENYLIDFILKTFNENEEFTISNFFENEHSTDQIINQLCLSAAEEINKYLDEQINFDKLEIPAIILEEDSAEFASEIFQALNTGGVTLSKYDIYAASWTDTPIKVNINCIRKI